MGVSAEIAQHMLWSSEGRLPSSRCIRSTPH
jgi:hypothetical protein